MCLCVHTCVVYVCMLFHLACWQINIVKCKMLLIYFDQAYCMIKVKGKGEHLL